MPFEAIHFFERKFPSSNMILIWGNKPVLIDTGFGSDLQLTELLLREAGFSPAKIQIIINTHYHSDHVGGNSGLQRNYGISIAAHRWEAKLINNRNREACSAEWLDQPIEPYQIDLLLSDGDEINTGNVMIQALHIPGHTLGHIALYMPESQELVCGDCFQKNDVGWINIFREGAASIEISLNSIEKLAKLPLQRAYPGHGPIIDTPSSVIVDARRRLEKWLAHPEKAAWHACKRILAYALIIRNGLNENDIKSYLLKCGWFNDFSRNIFNIEPVDFIKPLINEMIRSAAAEWKNGNLVAVTPHNPPGFNWSSHLPFPRNWSN